MTHNFVKACEDILYHDVYMQSHQYIHHSSISCRDHTLFVAYTCYQLNKRLGLEESSLLKSALLHDLYLYDWHVGHPDSKGPIKLHGLFHPEKAVQNAKKHFSLSPVEENAILSHMWPLTLFTPPKSKVAWVLCFVDKYCAIVETLSSKKRHWLKSSAQKIYDTLPPSNRL